MNKSVPFLVEVAKRYYLESMSQTEIAKLYHLSRPSVANILKLCRQRGIVEIRINDSSPLSSPAGEELKTCYGLQTACVVPNDIDETLTLYQVCQQAALFFASLMTNRIRIGISWGMALYHTIRQFPKLEVSGLEVVQLMGGLGASAPFYDGMELARIMAEKLNAAYYLFQAPLLVQSPEVRKILLSEAGIRTTVEKTQAIDIALFGLGADQSEERGLVRAGFLSPQEAREIDREGPSVEICGYYWDEKGKFLDIPVNRRVVGIDPEVFTGIPRRIGIACGQKKRGTIRAALRGRLVTDLFTDEATALQILADP